MFAGKNTFRPDEVAPEFFSVLNGERQMRRKFMVKSKYQKLTRKLKILKIMPKLDKIVNALNFDFMVAVLLITQIAAWP